MNMMLIEVFACLVAASLLGLIVGWMIKGTLASQRMDIQQEEWNSKLNRSQLKAQQETGHFENQIGQMDAEMLSLRSENESLAEALRENELIVHKARTDSIELNRSQAATQEQLQRLLHVKDQEIEKLKSGSHASNLLRKAAQSGSVSAAALAKVTQMRAQANESSPLDDDAIERIKTLNSKKDHLEKEQQQLMDALAENQDTVAIDSSDLPSELFDETVRLEDISSPMNKHDSTEYHDATVVLGDDTLPDAFTDSSTIDTDSK